MLWISRDTVIWFESSMDPSCMGQMAREPGGPWRAIAQKLRSFIQMPCSQDERHWPIPTLYSTPKDEATPYSSFFAHSTESGLSKFCLPKWCISVFVDVYVSFRNMFSLCNKSECLTPCKGTVMKKHSIRTTLIELLWNSLWFFSIFLVPLFKIYHVCPLTKISISANMQFEQRICIIPTISQAVEQCSGCRSISQFLSLQSILMCCIKKKIAVFVQFQWSLLHSTAHCRIKMNSMQQ